MFALTRLSRGRRGAQKRLEPAPAGLLGLVLSLIAIAGLLAWGLSAATGAPVKAFQPVVAYVSIWGNGLGNTVVPVNTTTNIAGHPITVGPEPSAIAITPNGRTAYVVIEGTEGTSGPGVTPVNSATNKAGRRINVGSSPGFIAITKNGNTAYVSNIYQAFVTPFETATNTAGKRIVVPQGPGPIVMTPDGEAAYVASSGGTVTPINTAINEAGTPITFAKRAEAGSAYIAVTPNGRTVYAFDSGPYGYWNTVIPVSTSTNKTGKAITVGEDPIAIAITPDGKTAYVASTGLGPIGCSCSGDQNVTAAAVAVSATVTPITTGTNAPRKAIKIAGGVSDMAVTANGKILYVTGGAGVTVIDTATNKVRRVIKVGGPGGLIAITPNGKTAYVVVGDTLVPIQTATGETGKGIRVGVNPRAIAFTP
jgi:YVTN family beta-propeller protein